jgi:hypothetical protein
LPIFVCHWSSLSWLRLVAGLWVSTWNRSTFSVSACARRSSLLISSGLLCQGFTVTHLVSAIWFSGIDLRKQLCGVPRFGFLVSIFASSCAVFLCL